MKFTLKAGWNAIKTLTKGYTSYYESYISMKFRMDDGLILNNNKQIIRVLAKNFYNVYNRKVNID